MRCRDVDLLNMETLDDGFTWRVKLPRFVAFLSRYSHGRRNVSISAVFRIVAALVILIGLGVQGAGSASAAVPD
jgi:hypothetical protein